MPLLRIALVFLCGLLTFQAPAQAAGRVALVIGNAAYVDSPLKNPINDARAVGAKLRDLGFRVQLVENLKRNQIGRMLNGFASSIRPGDEVVVFYAGHGLQVKGVNYLPAVDAEIHAEEDVPLNSLSLNALLDRLDEAKAGVKLLFMDACRNNPYARSFRSGSRGLARVGEAPSGTLMHFATRPGSVAADSNGPGGANGLYTHALLQHLDRPGVPVEQMLKRVAALVEQTSQGQQEPWVEGSLKGEFLFAPTPARDDTAVRPSGGTGSTVGGAGSSRRWVTRHGHTMGPIVVTSMPDGNDEVWTLEGVYPVSPGDGNPAPAADEASFYATQLVGNEWVHDRSLDQKTTGLWKPGEAFVVKVRVPRSLALNKAQMSVTLCVGPRTKFCHPSANLHPAEAAR